MGKVLYIFGRTIYATFVLTALAFALLFLGTRVDFLGYQVKVVQSGSMEPAIGVGSIVVVAPSPAYRLGEVITFNVGTRRSVPVTHRIVEVKQEGTRTAYLTKGDANEEADSNAVAARDVIGKVALTIPYVGYLIDFARTPLGYGLLVGLPALLIILDEFADIIFEIHKYRFKRRRQGQVGYRTPSRERNPRDFARVPDLIIKPNRKNYAPPRPKMLDIRSYETSQFSS